MSDFTNTIDSGVLFSSMELDEGVDFVASGDEGVIIIEASAYGEGAYGEGPYGGDETIIISAPTTIWTNIDTP